MSSLKVIRLLEPGFEKFTGRFGPIDFTDGVSNYAVSPQQADSFLISIHGEYVEISGGPSASETELKGRYEALLTQYKATIAAFDEYKAAHPE